MNPDSIDIERTSSAFDTSSPVDIVTEKPERPPPYSQVGSPTNSFSLPIQNRTSENASTKSTKSKGRFDILILLCSFASWCIVILGIAESVVYAIYYSSYRYILPAPIVFIPIIGGGPVQVFLGGLAILFCQIRQRRFSTVFYYLLAFTLFLDILCGIAIPAVSLGLNKNAATDVTAIVAALQAAPPGVLSGYADMYQSCTYNIPANDTRYTPLDAIPQYLDPNCRFINNTCNVPVQSCSYSVRAYICTDSTVEQSTGPCNVLNRVVYQVNYDWNKLGKQADIWAMGVWGFWFIVDIVFCVREYT